VASILSKKLAGGAGNLIFDVKVGDGAFMPTLPAARNLADALIRIAKLHGKRVEALVTDMDQPLGKMSGNALEIIEVVQILKPTPGVKPDQRLHTLCLSLASNALMLATNITEAEASKRVMAALDSGDAFLAFKSIVAAQGGDTRVLDDTSLFPPAPFVRDVIAPLDGYISRIPARVVGDAVVSLGGGRAVKSDVIDHRVGIETLVHVGDAVRPGDRLFRVHAASDDAASGVSEQLINAISVSDIPIVSSPVVIERRT
jgi:pyrimidine-nucleoside phosphorylase